MSASEEKSQVNKPANSVGWWWRSPSISVINRDYFPLFPLKTFMAEQNLWRQFVGWGEQQPWVHHLPRLPTFWLKATFLSVNICLSLEYWLLSSKQPDLICNIRTRAILEACYSITTERFHLFHLVQFFFVSGFHFSDLLGALVFSWFPTLAMLVNLWECCFYGKVIFN